MKIIKSVVLFLFICVPVFSENKPIITVLDFEASGISKAEVTVFVDYVTSHIVETGRYLVIDRMQREALLAEIEFSVSDCTDESCQLQIGKLLSASQIIVGSIGKVGSRYILNMKLIDVETGVTLKTASEKYGSIDDLIDDSKRLATRFVGKGEAVEDTTEKVKEEAVSSIVFENLRETSTVLVDGKDSTGAVLHNRLELEAGKHTIIIMTPGMKDFKKTITLKSGTEQKLKIAYKTIPEKGKTTPGTFGLTGYILGGSGAAFMAVSLVLNMDDIAAGMTDSYDSYASMKHGTFGFIIGGTALTLAGSAVIISSLLKPSETPEAENARLRLWGLILGGGGAGLAVLGFVFNMDDIAAGMTDSYSGYTTLKDISFGCIIGGAGIFVTGGIMYITSLLSPGEAENSKAGATKLSFYPLFENGTASLNLQYSY
ncbi:MAG: PEGA domain-containing protein [Spirochaetales bacterium]|nr:PEGA domain-containing protein [Spirochaetales bacterium]